MRIAGAALLVLALAATVVAGAESKFTTVDLQPKGNQRLADSLHNADGNHLAEVPRGDQKFLGVPYRIGEKMVHVRGEHSPDAPERVEGIKIDATFDRLHVLHSTGYGEAPKLEDGTEIGAYVVHYADKTSARIPIIYGQDLRDWWDWPDRPEATRAKIAWTGSNPFAAGNERKIRLFAMVWDNPQPAKQVATLEMQSSGTMCDPFLVALTLEKK